MSRLTADERMQRMLSIVPWVAGQDGVPVDEVCERFQIDRKTLLDGFETLAFVGVHPYTPDALVDVVVDHDRVRITLPDFFTRPLRLTPAQAFALLAAGRSLQAVPGADAEGPLARGLAKLAATLGTGSPAVVEVDLGEAAGDSLSLLQQAVAERRSVEIDYYSYGRDVQEVRRVDPWRVQAEQGQWYLEAWCHRSDAERVFRVDRIRSVALLDETFVRPEQADPLRVFQPAADDPRIVLDLSPGAAWVVGQYPVEEVDERPDGSLRVTLAIAARPWLERLLLRLGPDARVVEAPPALAGAGAAAARRVLERYER
jgi:proteasome accessory factor C